MLKQLYTKNKQLILYAFFGGAGVLSDVSLYSILISVNLNYQIANACGYALGTLISFFLNRQYTFNAKDKILKRLFSFFAVAFIGYMSSVGILFILIELLGFNLIIAKLLTLFFVLAIQFTLNKKITFKSKQ